MSPPSRGSLIGERGSLLKSPSCAAEEGREVVLWAGGASEGGGRGFPRAYPAMFLWDALVFAVLFGPCSYAMLLGAIVILQPAGWEVLLYRLWWHRAHWILSAPLVLGVLLVLAMIPRRVVREADALALEFPLHRRSVPLEEVVELAVLDRGVHHFLRLLSRTGTFPFGPALRWFCGLPSNGGVMFVLVAARGFWSFVFCLEDPVQFLVENQRPLDLGARYRTTNNVRVREGEALTSRKVALLRRGQYLRIKEQRGRRVLVEFEDGKTRGWMSYINQLGRFLLAKERVSDVPMPGTVGASSLTGTYGAAIELPAVGPEGDE